MKTRNAESRIVPAGPAELAAIRLLADATWRAHYTGIISSEQIEYMLQRMYDLEVMRQELCSGICYDQLFCDDDLVAFASYGPVLKELKLHKLYVHPERQRQGFGTMLLRHVEEHAKRQGLHRLILAVNKGNQKAVAAYEKNGFAIRESVVVDIGGGFVMDDYVMHKAL